MVDGKGTGKAGMVEEEMGPAERGAETTAKGMDWMGVGEVKGQGLGVAAAGADFGGDARGAFGGKIGHGDMAAFGGENKGGGGAKAAAGAGEGKGQSLDGGVEWLELGKGWSAGGGGERGSRHCNEGTDDPRGRQRREGRGGGGGEDKRGLEGGGGSWAGGLAR